MTPEEAALQAALDANPLDHLSRRVLSDHLFDLGDPRAEGYAMLGWAGCAPAGPGNEIQVGQREWCWLQIVTGRSGGCNLKSYWFCHLTLRVMTLGSRYAAGKTLVTGKYPRYDSRKEAEDDAALAWLRVKAETRERDLREAMSRR